MNLIRRILDSGFWADTQGAVATEYALMVGLITLAIFAAVTLFGTTLGSLYANAVDKLPF